LTELAVYQETKEKEEYRVLLGRRGTRVKQGTAAQREFLAFLAQMAVTVIQVVLEQMATQEYPACRAQ